MAAGYGYGGDEFHGVLCAVCCVLCAVSVCVYACAYACALCNGCSLAPARGSCFTVHVVLLLAIWLG
jgi:hypothetical protein